MIRRQKEEAASRSYTKEECTLGCKTRAAAGFAAKWRAAARRSAWLTIGIRVPRRGLIFAPRARGHAPPIIAAAPHPRQGQKAETRVGRYAAVT